MLAEEIGLPAGVLNIVTGTASQISGALCESPPVRKIIFTASTEVGETPIRAAAGSVKKVSMQLGGNGPLIVFDGADLDRAVDGAIAAKFCNAGQTCVCASRIFVEDGIHEAFAEKVAAAAAKLTVATALPADTQQGPMVNAETVDKVESLIADATTKGARLVSGSRRSRGGLFFERTVLANANLSMAFMHEEIFGPVAPIFRFTSERRSSRWRTTPSIPGMLNDLGRALRVTKALKFGMVG